MLSEKPWKPEALLRLFLGVFICVLIGAVITSAVRFLGGAGKVDARVFAALIACSLAFLGGVLFLVRRPWPLEEATRHFMVLLGCLYGGLTLASFAQQYAGGAGLVNPIWLVVIATVSFQGATLLLTHRFLREHQTSWADAFGFGNQRGRALGFGAVLACLYLPTGSGLKWVLAQAMTFLGREPAEQQAVVAGQNAEGWLEWTAFGVAVIILAPVAEEILFRGLLYPKIKQAGFPRLALWGTALLFATVHWNIVDFIPLLLLAVALTLLYEWTNNLLAPIATHSLFNAVNFILLLVQARSARAGGP